MNIEQFRRRLLAEEQLLLKRLGRDIESARETQSDQGDVGDLARVDEMKDAYFAGAESDSARLGQVRDALTRIDDDTFGQCIVDGGAIGEKRLEAMPWTPYCLQHQEELERANQVRTPTL